MTLDELERLVPPPAETPAVDWTIEVPEDYKALVARYGAANIGGLQLLVPGHENRFLDMARQIEPQRSAVAHFESPYPPEQLLPWGIDESGNVVWFFMDGDWPVVANEARGFDWLRYDGGPADFLAAILTGRLKSDFLSIE